MPDLRNSHAAGYQYESQGTSLASTASTGVIYNFASDTDVWHFHPRTA